jgi:hypothetical protein
MVFMKKNAFCLVEKLRCSLRQATDLLKAQTSSIMTARVIVVVSLHAENNDYKRRKMKPNLAIILTYFLKILRCYSSMNSGD